MSARNARVIVVGYDGSATAKAAVDYAAREAGRRGSVHVVHACSPVEEEAHARALIDGLALEDDPLLDTRWEAELVFARPVDALLETARKRGADQIVVGSRGRGLLARTALGSVSHELLQRSDVPVVVIPPVREPA
jgi:nucleotide-binding universal stress UspA family protein